MLPAVVQFGECAPSALSFRAGLIGEESAFARPTADSSRL